MEVLPASPLKSTPMISEQETRSGPCSMCAADSDRAIAQLLRYSCFHFVGPFPAHVAAGLTVDWF